MGEPIQNVSAKNVSFPSSVEGKEKPVRCRDDEMIYKRRDGKKVCVFNPLSGLMPVTISCGRKIGIPCDYGKENFGVVVEKPYREETINPPPPSSPQSQFKPASSEEIRETNKTADTVTRIAEYECARSRYTKVPVTIRFIPNEAPEKTEDRFEKAAEIELRGMKFRKEDAKCKSLSFARFLPTAGDVSKAKKTESTKPNSFNPLTAYGDSMRDCQKAIGSYILCKPQP